MGRGEASKAAWSRALSVRAALPLKFFPPPPLLSQLYRGLAEIWSQSTGTIRIDLRRPTIPESDVRPNLFESVPAELWPRWVGRGDAEARALQQDAGWGGGAWDERGWEHAAAWGDGGLESAAGWGGRRAEDAWEREAAWGERAGEGGAGWGGPGDEGGAGWDGGRGAGGRGGERDVAHENGRVSGDRVADGRGAYAAPYASTTPAPQPQRPSAPPLGGDAVGAFARGLLDPGSRCDASSHPAPRFVDPRRAPSPVVAFRVESEEASRAPSPRPCGADGASPDADAVKSHPVPHDGPHGPRVPFSVHEPAYAPHAGPHRGPASALPPQTPSSPPARPSAAWTRVGAGGAAAGSAAHGAAGSHEQYSHGASRSHEPYSPNAAATDAPETETFANPLADGPLRSAPPHPFGEHSAHWSDDLPPPPRLAAALAALARDPRPPRPATRPTPAGGGLGRLGRKGRPAVSLPATGARVRVLRHWRLGAVPPPEIARIGAIANGDGRCLEGSRYGPGRGQGTRRWWPFGGRSGDLPRYPAYPALTARPRHLDDGWSVHERRTEGAGSDAAVAPKPWWAVLRDGGSGAAGASAAGLDALSPDALSGPFAPVAPFSRGLGESAVALAQWRDAAPIDVAAGFSVDLDTAALKPVLGVRCGPHLELRALPEASIRASGRLPLRSLGAAVRLSYECPIATLSTPFAPPATLKAFLEPLRPSGLRVTSRGVDLDARAPLDGGRASARIDASLLAPTALPVRRDGSDKLQVRVRRLGVSWMW